MNNNVKVLIDGFFFGKPYGFGRYVEELIYSIQKYEKNTTFIVALPEDVLKTTHLDFPHIAKKRIMFPLWEQIVLPRLARSLGCNVLHHPYNTSSIKISGVSRIVTVHDLFFKDHSSKGSVKDHVYSQYSRLAYRYGTRHCKNIVAISKATSQRLNIDNVQSSIIYNTVDRFVEMNSQPGKNTSSFPRAEKEGFFLHRGGYEDHRNTKRVIEAFRVIKLEAPLVSLKILGAPLGANFWGTAVEEGIDFLPRLDDAEVASLYRSSLGVVAVALREGFGLPVLEGFGFSAPVITSNRPPMIEVAGDAAILIDPTNVPQMIDAMRQLLIAENRTKFAGKARDQFMKFGSRRFAEEYARTYELAAKEIQK